MTKIRRKNDVERLRHCYRHRGNSSWKKGRESVYESNITKTFVTNILCPMVHKLSNDIWTSIVCLYTYI